MAARRCSLCGISYPPEQKFARCPVHDEPTAWFNNTEPDEHWEWAATALIVRQENASREVDGVPILPLEPEPLIDDLYVLNAHEVIRARAQLVVDAVFMVLPDESASTSGPCDCYWEVVGYYDADRKWVVRPLRVPDYAPTV